MAHASATAVTISTTQTMSGTAQGGLQRVAFWVGIRTPFIGSACQVRLSCIDSLGFTSESFSGLLDGAAAGSIQGYLSAQYDGSGAYTFNIDYFGVPGMAYDYEFDQKEM